MSGTQGVLIQFSYSIAVVESLSISRFVEIESQMSGTQGVLIQFSYSIAVIVGLFLFW